MMVNMERRYYRQYENYDTVVPRLEDFPVLQGRGREAGADESLPRVAGEAKADGQNMLFGFKLDDIILIAVIVLLLMEEEKDLSAIITLAILFLSEYLT